jgi:cytochrome c oxidase subunit IV
MAHAPAAHFDELDPHGASHKGQHKAHVIVGPFTLRTVLAILLFFTVLTVAQAQAEIYISHALDVEFPRWVNIAFCMGIAVVKALLVMGYFMQLKYDNPINSVVMAFTFLGLALFLGFTSLDLGARGSVYAWKVPNPVAGGTLEVTKKAHDALAGRLSTQEFARIHAIITHDHAAHEDTASGPQRSRARTGLSGALDATDSHYTDSHEAAPAGHTPAAPAGH